MLAIVASALAHAGIFYLVLVVLPRLLTAHNPPPAYTVKIVDALPAGDLGTHLPRLNQSQPPPPATSVPQASEPPPPPSTPPPIEEEADENAVALNILHQTRTPTPTPSPAPSHTVAPTPGPRPTRTPRPTPRPRPTRTPTERPTPTFTVTPRPRHNHRPAERPTLNATPIPRNNEHRHVRPTPAPPIAVARTAPTPSVRDRLAKLRADLLADNLRHLKAESKGSNEDEGGPIAGNRNTAGTGYGVGPGSGSAGILQDAGFLLYYQQVQKKIKDAWSFAGNNPELTATVTFGINPDGTLNSIKVTNSSRDPAFDDSVVRAIRRASPFAPPPPKYRAEFMQGIEAQFKLGELNS